MADKKVKSLNISIDPAQIVGSEIMKSGDYKYARMGVKLGDDQYLSVSYEWKGDTIPEFVMGLMGWMQSSKEEIKENKEEFAALKERTK
jgi:hypothetical protein